MDENWRDLCKALLTTDDRDEFARLIGELNLLFDREEITRRRSRKAKLSPAPAEHSGFSQHDQQR